jgi:hypothetical protein
MYLEPGPAVFVVRNRSKGNIDVGVDGGLWMGVGGGRSTRGSHE